MSKISLHKSPLPPFLDIRQEAITALCKTHRIRYLYAIGSVLHPNHFRPDSDVDLLFAFDEAAIPDEAYNPNLWAFWHALEALFNRKVDLLHGPSLKNPYLIEEIEETKRLLYEQENEEISLGHSSKH